MSAKHQVKAQERRSQREPVNQNAKLFSVTIIRPQKDEVQEEVRIGFAQLAKVIAQRIREEETTKESRAPVSMIDLVRGGKED